MVNIKAIPMLSKIEGYNPNRGNNSNCIKMASKNPLPTSMKLSIKLLI